jgi:3-oxoacyl-[acyl-carrier-protein] synthase III
LAPDDIDLIVVATVTPDTLMPSTACWLQARLRCKRAIAFDINAACSGFVYALSVADNFVRAGGVKSALVVG